MGLSNLKNQQQRSKEECLQVIGSKIDLKNLNDLAELAERPGINAKLSSKMGMVKKFV